MSASFPPTNPAGDSNPQNHALAALSLAHAKVTKQINQQLEFGLKMDDYRQQVSKVIDLLTGLSAVSAPLAALTANMIKDLHLVRTGLKILIDEAERDEEKLLELRRQFRLALAWAKRERLLKPDGPTQPPAPVPATVDVVAHPLAEESAAPVEGPLQVMERPGGRCLVVIAGKTVKLPARRADLFCVLVRDDRATEPAAVQMPPDGLVRWKRRDEVRAALATQSKGAVTLHHLEVLVDRLQSSLSKAGLDPRLVQEDSKLGLRFAVKSTLQSATEMENGM